MPYESVWRRIGPEQRAPGNVTFRSRLQQAWGPCEVAAGNLPGRRAGGSSTKRMEIARSQASWRIGPEQRAPGNVTFRSRLQQAWGPCEVAAGNLPGRRAGGSSTKRIEIARSQASWRIGPEQRAPGNVTFRSGLTSLVTLRSRKGIFLRRGGSLAMALPYESVLPNRTRATPPGNVTSLCPTAKWQA